MLPEDYFIDLAMRLASAYTSHAMRYAGIDRTYKETKESGIVGEYWVELAKCIHKSMTDRELPRSSKRDIPI